MRAYATVSPLFWTGSTGKRLRNQHDAQLISLYLMTSPHAHQSGIYCLPIMYLCHETGRPLEGAYKALSILDSEGYCKYDRDAEWVWVCEMAAWQIGSDLAANDKRCKGLQQYLKGLPDLPFMDAFIARYASDFHLTPTAGRGLEGASSEQNRTEQNITRTEQTDAGASDVTDSGTTPESKPRGHSRGKQIPDDFTLDDELTAYATSRLPGVIVPALLENFRNHHKATGKPLKDWRAAWRTWVGNAVGYGYPGDGRRAGPLRPTVAVPRSKEFGT